jgi:hypothetical protein
MKIDTSSPRIPLHRLKHSVKEKRHLPEPEAGIDAKVDSAFSETFERELIQDGARKFKEWLEKFEIK